MRTGPATLRTVAACVATAAVVTVLSAGLPVVPGLLWPSSDGPPPRSPHLATPPVGAEEGVDGLRLHVQMPTRLRAGGTAPVRVQLSPGTTSTLRSDDLAELRLRLDMTDGLRGRIWASPPRMLIRAGELHRARISVGALQTVPCDRSLGELRVELRVLNADVGQVATSTPLPPVRCASTGLPDAPASLHLDTPVCGDDWREQVELLLEGQTLPPAPCRPAPAPRSGADRSTGEPTPEPEEPEEADTDEGGVGRGEDDDEQQGEEDERDTPSDENDDEDRDEDEDRDGDEDTEREAERTDEGEPSGDDD